MAFLLAGGARLFHLELYEFELVMTNRNLFKFSLVVHEEAPGAVGAVPVLVKLGAGILLVLVNHWVLLDQLVLTVGELTFLAVATRTLHHPVFAQFCLVH